MSPAKRKLRMAAIADAATLIEERGTCWADWARSRNLPLQAVRNVLKGRGPCMRGAARQAADAMLIDVRIDPGPEIKCTVCGKPSPETLELLADMAAKLAALQSGLDRLLGPDRQEGDFPIAGTCRSCGCTDLQACPAEDGPCYWVEPSLCSACVDPAGEPLEAA